jgi:hypothetical protein
MVPRAWSRQSTTKSEASFGSHNWFGSRAVTKDERGSSFGFFFCSSFGLFFLAPVSALFGYSGGRFGSSFLDKRSIRVITSQN